MIYPRMIMQSANTALLSGRVKAKRDYPSSRLLTHKRSDFWKQVIEHKMCVLIFSTTSFWNISHFKKNWARCVCMYVCSKMYIGFRVEYRLFLSDFN